MKLSIFLACPLLALAAPASSQEQASVEFTAVPLQSPLNWEAGGRLFPGNVIAGYNADYEKYNAETWAQYILEQCRGFPACTSTLSNSAINSGTPKLRYWFGYVFRGGETSQDDYTRGDDVEDSVAYTIAK